MPAAQGSVAKSVLVVTALAAITGALIFQTLAMRDARGEASRPAAVAPHPAPPMIDAVADSDVGPGLVESTLVSSPAGPGRGAR